MGLKYDRHVGMTECPSRLHAVLPIADTKTSCSFSDNDRTERFAALHCPNDARYF